ncbi:CPBP family intramembrane glutamic endopeptidase [Aeropyrum camini]|uniref:CPBP family intramembrane glutamic endopeptidase n=1 Tax=Aeropyrum camini TaxID=229980 RepID=UPI000788A377|nr:CPBP family intramembrane glutamic endopeptidase [Aeropyrum camini]
MIRGLATFMAVAYLGAYVLDYIAIIPLLSADNPYYTSLALPLLLVVRMLLPGAGVAGALVVEGSNPIEAFRSLSMGRPSKWLPFSAGLPLLGYLIAVPFTVLMGGSLSPCGPLGAFFASSGPIIFMFAVIGLFILALIAGSTLNAVVALGEEIGWRWYLLSRFEKLFGWRASALIIGVIWGLWHAPLILHGYNYSSLPGDCGEAVRGIWALTAFIIYTTATSLLLTALVKHSGTVAAAAVAHGVINAVGGCRPF